MYTVYVLIIIFKHIYLNKNYAINKVELSMYVTQTQTCSALEK